MAHDPIRAEYLLILLALFIAVAAGCQVDARVESRAQGSHCYSAEATRWFRCWSGGQLVYEELIHKNGGYRCTTDGRTVLVPYDDGGLCIEEEIGPKGEAESE